MMEFKIIEKDQKSKKTKQVATKTIDVTQYIGLIDSDVI